jgi:UDPglucose 6-dehydrogenase
VTYKPITDVVEEAVGLLLAQELTRRAARVIAYDPAGSRNSAVALGERVRLMTTAQECIKESEAVVVATPWKEFAEIPTHQWARDSLPRSVIDCWRTLNHLDGVDGVRYVRLGFGGKAERPVGVSWGAR